MEKKAILIDTNIFIDHLRNHKQAVSYMQSLVGKDNVFFSAITETELLVGTENNNTEKRKLLLRLLYQWKKVSVANPLAKKAGDLAREHGMSVPDAIIAATALQEDAALITRNVKDFRKVEGIEIKTPY
jgi:predicted nucleic acid-binding protein